MNVFVLDEDPEIAAQCLCDKHVVKVLTEVAQLLSNGYYASGQNHLAPYMPSNYNTRLANWSYFSMENWYWLLAHGIAIYLEYKYRYHDKEHKGGETILSMANNPPKLPSYGMTKHAMNMPEEYKQEDVVEAYRNYYIHGKGHLLKYTRRPPPDWI